MLKRAFTSLSDSCVFSFLFFFLFETRSHVAKADLVVPL